MLRILLLGTPIISLDDTPQKIVRKLQRALLFYLAERGGPVGREELIGLFWPEENEQIAHRHLSQALARLRAELPDRRLLIISVPQISLDFKQVYVDLLEFRALLIQAGNLRWQLPSQFPLTVDVAQMLTHAIRLWRSSQFMAGYSLPDSPALQNWYTVTRQELELQRQRLAERLADHAMARGDQETTLNWLLTAFQNEDMDEELNGRILNLMIDMGQRSAAITFFNHLKELYRQADEWPVPQAILEAFSRTTQVNSPNGSYGLPGWPATMNFQLPLVGRTTALRDLQGAYHRGGVVIIHGEAGVGKTRLVQEFFYSLAPAPRLLLAAARPTEGSLPFQVIIEMLRHYISAEDWQELPSSWGRQIVALLPELQVLRPEFETPASFPDKPAQPLLFEAIRQLLIQVAQQQRLFVFLDDVQWADESSLQALAFLLQRCFFDAYGLLVIAVRSENHTPQLAQVLDLFRRSTTCYDLSLPLLENKEIAELVSRAMGQPAREALVERLAKETGGNPLFILLTVRSLLDAQTDPNAIQPSDALPLASSIRAMLRERLSNVNPQTRKVALIAAVIGSTFEFDVLEKACQIPEEAIAQAVEEMESLNFIRAVHANPQHRIIYSFFHDKIREVLLLEISQPRRRLLHRRVAQALEASLGGRAAQQAAVLAQHYESAGDLSLAFDWWLQAAQRARQLFSISEAEAAFKRAEQLLQTLDGELNDEQLYQLYTQWGEMIYETHGVEALRRVYTTLLHLGEERQSHLLIGAALSGLSNAAIFVLDLENGLDCARQALAHLTQAGDLFELAQAYNHRGILLGLSGRYLEARAAVEQSLAVTSDCQGSSCLQARATSQYHIALFLCFTGWPAKAITYAENALQENPILLQPYNRMRFYSELILSNFLAGNFAAAREYSQKGIDLAQKMQSWRLLSYIQAHAAQTELVLGNLDASLEYALNALKLDQSYDLIGATPRAYSTLGDIFHILGEYDRAIEAYQKGLEGKPENYKRMDITRRLGYSLGMAGQIERSMATITQVITQAEAAGLEFISIPAHMRLAALYLMIGEKEKARQEALDASRMGQERGLYSVPFDASLLLGQIALSEEDTATAEHYARQLIDQTRRPASMILEIYGLVLLLQVQRRKQQDDPQSWERLIQRLDEVETHARNPEIAPLFRAYRKKLLMSLQD